MLFRAFINAKIWSSSNISIGMQIHFASSNCTGHNGVTCLNCTNRSMRDDMRPQQRGIIHRRWGQKSISATWTETAATSPPRSDAVVCEAFDDVDALYSTISVLVLVAATARGTSFAAAGRSLYRPPHAPRPPRPPRPSQPRHPLRYLQR
jgi:hypothetical protein